MAIGEQVSLDWHRFGDFSAAQLYEVLRFRQAIFVVAQASPYPDLDGLDHHAEHLLARQGGALAGCLRLIPYVGESRVAIGRLAVGRRSRRQGLARCMMQEALARCERDYRACAITLSAQTYLAPFYEDLGFRAVSPAYDDYGVPHVDMERRPDG